MYAQLSELAAKDLEQIADYLAADSPETADRFLDAVERPIPLTGN